MKKSLDSLFSSVQNNRSSIYQLIVAKYRLPRRPPAQTMAKGNRGQRGFRWESVMAKGSGSKSGIQLLLEKYRELFRTPENLNHYLDTDFRRAERKFLKHALEQRGIGIKDQLSRDK